MKNFSFMGLLIVLIAMMFAIPPPDLDAETIFDLEQVIEFDNQAKSQLNVISDNTGEYSIDLPVEVVTRADYQYIQYNDIKQKTTKSLHKENRQSRKDIDPFSHNNNSLVVQHLVLE